MIFLLSLLVLCRACSTEVAPRRLQTGTIELGKVTLEGTDEHGNGISRTVNFSQELSDPVVVCMVATHNDLRSVICRIKSITSSGFDLILEELHKPEESGNHSQEEVTYMAVDLSNLPHNVQAGNIELTEIKQFQDINFGSSYSAEPCFFASIQTYNSQKSPLVVIKKVENDYFRIGLDEYYDNYLSGDVSALIGWIAIPKGSYNFGFHAEFDRTGYAVNHNKSFYTTNYMIREMGVLGTMISFTGGDDGYVRGYSSDNNNEVAFHIEEDQLNNNDREHSIQEEVSWVAFSTYNCFFIEGVCQDFCPTGFPEDLECQKSDTLIFHLTLDVIQDTVTYQGISVTTGEDEFFYPEYKLTDPRAAFGRGYYFTGTSHMTFSSGFALAPSFVIAAWIKPDSVTGSQTLFSKVASGDELIDFAINSGKPVLKLLLANGKEFTVYSDHSVKIESWNLVYFKGYIDATYGVTLGVNLDQASTNSIYKSWYYDTQLNYQVTIGTNQLSSQKYFKGFLYELKIYNGGYPAGDLMSSNCGECDYCPQPDNCIVLCSLSEFWNGSACEPCEEYCENGCVTLGTCNLCEDKLCYRCTSFIGSCTECTTNASMTSGICECDSGYYPDVDECKVCIQEQISAYYSKNYLNLTIESSERIQESKCTEVFSSAAISSFGQGHECLFSFYKVTVVLGDNFAALDSLVLRSLYSNNTVCGFYENQIQVQIEKPHVPKPVAQLETPTTVLKCQNLIATSKSYQEDLLYKWTVEGNSALSKYNLDFSSASQIQINSNDLTEGLVSITMEVKNILGEVVSTTNSVQVSESLIVNIDGSEFQVKRPDSLSISVPVSTCEESVSLEYFWKVTSISNNLTAFEEDSFWASQKSPRHLYIGAYSLPGLSEVEFQVEVKDTLYSFKGEASFTVKVLPSVPKLFVDTADGNHGVSQVLRINTDRSYDPDGFQLLFEWNCTSGTSSCSKLISNTSSTLCEVLPNLMQPQVTYAFTVKALKSFDPSIYTTTTIRITATQETVPQVKFYQQNLDGNIANPQKAVRILALFEANYRFLWSKSKGGSLVYDSAIDSPNLVIREGSLDPGDTYTIQVEVDSYPFFWTFYVNKPPGPGTFTVTPSKGSELSTVFKFQASNWTDPENHIPLTYSFGVLSETQTLSLSSKNTSAFLYSKLPYLGKNLKAYVEVYDSYATKSGLEFPIQVELSENFQEQEVVEDFKSQLANSSFLDIPQHTNSALQATINRELISDHNSSYYQEVIDLTVGAAKDYIDSFNQVSTQTASNVVGILKSCSLNPRVNTPANLQKFQSVVKKLADTIDPFEITDQLTEEFLEVCENNLAETNPNEKTLTLGIVNDNINIFNSKIFKEMKNTEVKNFLKEKIQMSLGSYNAQSLNSKNVSVDTASVQFSNNISSTLLSTQYGVSVSLIPVSAENYSSILSVDLIGQTTSKSPIKLRIPISNPSQDLECQHLYQSIWETKDCKLTNHQDTFAECECKDPSVFSVAFSSAVDTFTDNNFDETVDLSNLQKVKSDTLGIYFCGVEIFLYVVMLMYSCKLDYDKEETPKARSNSKRATNTELNENYIVDTSNRTVVETPINTARDYSIPKIKDLIQTFKEKHEVLSIFYLHDKDKPRVVRSTFLATKLLGDMYLIGLFYRGESDSEDSEFWATVTEYSWRDFWVLVFSNVIMLVVFLVLKSSFKLRKRYSQSQCKKSLVTTLGLVVSWVMMAYFCWSIVVFSAVFEKKVNYKWIFNSGIDYFSEVLLFSFLRILITLGFKKLFSEEE